MGNSIESADIYELGISAIWLYPYVKNGFLIILLTFIGYACKDNKTILIIQICVTQKCINDLTITGSSFLFTAICHLSVTLLNPFLHRCSNAVG